MIDVDRGRDPHDEDDAHDTDNDLLKGIWASFSAPAASEQPGISVESIKERLKRGAAQRRAELGDHDSG